MNILARLFRSTPVSKEKILNTGLTMAMAFGSNWRQPISNKLQKRYTYLPEQDLEEYNTLCQTAMTCGNEYIYNMLNKLFEEGCTITNTELKEQFTSSMRNQYEWISDSNLRNLYSQSCIYAWRDGLDTIIVG